VYPPAGLHPQASRQRTPFVAFPHRPRPSTSVPSCRSASGHDSVAAGVWAAYEEDGSGRRRKVGKDGPEGQCDWVCTPLDAERTSGKDEEEETDRLRHGGVGSRRKRLIFRGLDSRTSS
jgi:hypothetical protein